MLFFLIIFAPSGSPEGFRNFGHRPHFHKLNLKTQAVFVRFFGLASMPLTNTNSLQTGEKVLPLEIEGRLRRDALIKEAVVFGIDRPVPGVLLTRSDIASDLPVAEFIDQVWSTIQYANSRAEAFSQITREMVIILPASAEIAVTDKMSVKRAKVYQEYAVLIDSAYSRLEDTVEGELQLDVPELERWIINTFHASLGVKLEPQTDFFLAGVDSLKAIQMRGLIVRSLDLGGAANVKEKGGALMVADAGNTARLASFLYALRVGGPCEQSEEIGAMQAVVEKLSSFDIHAPVSGRPTPEKSSVVRIPLLNCGYCS